MYLNETEDEELQLGQFLFLKTLDLNDWKNQNHYAVLGFVHVKYKVMHRETKAAHKAVVLNNTKSSW